MSSLTAPSVLQYKTYKIRKNSEDFYSFTFNDIMGLEQTANRGVHVEDLKLALMGHVDEGYQVQSFDLWHCLEGTCGVFLLYLHSVLPTKMHCVYNFDVQEM